MQQMRPGHGITHLLIRDHNLLIFFILEARTYHCIRRCLEYSHLERLEYALKRGMGEMNSRRRHPRQGSLLASIVPRPTQGFQVSVAPSRSGPVLWDHEEAYSPERYLSLIFWHRLGTDLDEIYLLHH